MTRRYYCRVTNIARPNPRIIQVHWEMVDAETDEVVAPYNEWGWSATLKEGGERIQETPAEKEQRFFAALNAYFADQIADAEEAEQSELALKDGMAGYRYPPADDKTRG